MIGMRKLIIAICIIAVATFVKLNEYQAEVLIVVMGAFTVGNITEHIGGIKNAVSKMVRRGNSNDCCSGSGNS
jgi:hypothetical protein